MNSGALPAGNGNRIADRIIVALDVESLKEAAVIMDKLTDEVRIFKVGLGLFTKEGPRACQAVRERGFGVFLDVKLHDIPNTVRAAAEHVVEMGVSMYNVHASGGFRMMHEASLANRVKADELGIVPPLLLGVTVLTSMGQPDLKSIGVGREVHTQVVELARLAKEAGLDGVVASGEEIRPIREGLGPDFVIVTPGVRPKSQDTGDQVRVVTPREAFLRGADYIVVGRPVIAADDPREAFLRIVDEVV